MPTDALLRIAMVAPGYFEVPPRAYGGVEAVIAGLVDGLVGRGHHVTLIGAGARGTRAQRFVATAPQASAARLGDALPEVTHTAQVARILELGHFDLVHDHTLAGPLLARGRRQPTVVTVHGPVTGADGDYYTALGRSVELVAISNAQRRSAAHLSWVATVYNGTDVASFPYRRLKEGYALFLGRFHPDKAPHLAIDAARAAGIPITLAGKCSEPLERDYFAAEITPRLGGDVTVLGPADAVGKRHLLSRAACLLFPIQWDEPFGLVMVEAMACGTPVVALARGSVPELVEDGLTGAIATRVEDLPAAIGRALALSPADCRTQALDRFDLAPMVDGYVAAYRAVLGARVATVVPLLEVAS